MTAYEPDRIHEILLGFDERLALRLEVLANRLRMNKIERDAMKARRMAGMVRRQRAREARYGVGPDPVSRPEPDPGQADEMERADSTAPAGE